MQTDIFNYKKWHSTLYLFTSLFAYMITNSHKSNPRNFALGLMGENLKLGAQSKAKSMDAILVAEL